MDCSGGPQSHPASALSSWLPRLLLLLEAAPSSLSAAAASLPACSGSATSLPESWALLSLPLPAAEAAPEGAGCGKGACRRASATLARLGLLRMVSCTGSPCSGLLWLTGWSGARELGACTADKMGSCAACRLACWAAGAVPGSGEASPAAAAGGCAPAGMLAKSSSAFSLPSTACACSLHEISHFAG